MNAPCWRVLPVLVVITLLLGGCASLLVADTTPLPADKLLPLGSDAISRGGYRFDALRRSEEPPDRLILVAMSGGGKRSAAFSFGVLKGMRDMQVPTRTGPQSLLSQLDGISGRYPAAASPQPITGCTETPRSASTRRISSIPIPTATSWASICIRGTGPG